MAIEKNVPIPEFGMNGKYGFTAWKVNDCEYFPDQPLRSQSLPSRAAHSTGARQGKKFTIRSEGTGVRIWRVS